MNKKPFHIIEKSKYFFIASAAVILAGIIMFVIMGFNLGLDFTEGATITVNYYSSSFDAADAGTTSVDDFKTKLEKKIEELGFTLGGVTRTSEATEYSVLEFSLKYEYNGKEVASDEFAELIRSTDDSATDLISELSDYIGELKVELYDDEILDSVTTADATKPLIKKAILAICVAVVIMLIYIAIRFKLISGICAVIVLLHDVLIMITFTILFRIEINTTFIAAIVTVIGYSINATIVVFDRIKEYENYKNNKDKTSEVYAVYRSMSDTEIANASIKETIKRTILTTSTTLITIVLLSILSSSIREFTLPIIFGLLSGVYSAIILASCLWVQAKKIQDKIQSNRKSGYEKHAKKKASETVAAIEE